MWAIKIFILILLCEISKEALGQTTQAGQFPFPTRLLLDMRHPKSLNLFEERALKPLDMFKECGLCPEMVVIPAGDFIMGAPATEEDSDDDERPQHKVVFARPFAVGRFAVTFDEWDHCVADGGCRRYRPTDRGWGRGRRPVFNLWWEDARSYVKWLSNKTGKPYRLLSEAEREYVTRAGTTSPFWWGSVLSTDRANYDGSFSYPFKIGETGESRGMTLPVDSFAPNPWGLYQVHGNVYEWVEDCWHPNYNNAPDDGSAWTSPDCNRHVLRGGSWHFPSWHVRAASRGAVAFAVAAMALPPVGLRVARALSR